MIKITSILVSPLTKLTTIRLFIALATAKNWILHQLDISNAFLLGYVDKEVYMLSPQGYTKAQSGEVCEVEWYLYRLKQASIQAMEY